MACRTPRDPQLIYGEIDESLSSAGIDRLNNSNKSVSEEGAEFDASTSSEESHIGSEGEETVAGSEQRTFLVIVNDDGSFTLDNSGVIVQSEDLDRVIPVTLPVNKMKSVEQPLPGARTLPTTSRSRKTKLQTRTGFGSESDSGYEFIPPSKSGGGSGIPVVELEGEDDTVSPLDIHLPNARGVLVSGTIPLEEVTTEASPTHSPAPASVIVQNPATIDLTDFTKQLDPQSLANLENVLQSEQAREILETLTFDDDIPEGTNSEKSVSVQPLWDHSYSQSVPITAAASSSKTLVAGPSSAVTSNFVINPIQSVIQTTSGNNTPIVSTTPVRRDSTSNAPITPVSVTMLPAMNALANNPKGRSSSGSSTSGSGSRRVSEAEANANIRRSQRQQDRIERQEAERIMAENQQMLQREKEIMKEAKGGSAVASPVNSPIPTAQPSPLMESPVPIASAKVVAVTPPPTAADDTPKSESGRPKRANRKLPAHLADPNYINFEEDAKMVKEISKTVDSENEEDEEVKADPDGDYAGEDGDEEEITEDDPNRLWCICRQPHNNRFMICCDGCEDWFHGKCVGVTKAQGKAMELKKMLWHCPNCKKAMKIPKSTQKAVANDSRRNSTSSSPVERSSSGRKVGRPAKLKDVPMTPVSSKIAEPLKDAALKQIRRPSDASATKGETMHKSANNCMVCGKTARKDSAYCSDKCVQKWATTVGNKATPSAKSAPTTDTSPIAPATSTTAPTVLQKLKRVNSFKQIEPEKAQPFLTFHVISAGSTKSTETVPPRPKELTASAIVKQNQMQQQQAQSPVPQLKSPTTPTSPIANPSVVGVSPNSVKAIIGSNPTVVVNKIVNAEGKQAPPPPPPPPPSKVVKGPPLKVDTGLASNQGQQVQSKRSGQPPPTPPPIKQRPRTASESSSSKSHKSPSTVKKVEKESPRVNEKDKDSERDGPTSEKLLRENMRKTIREVLKARMKDASEAEKKIFEISGNTPEIIAERIEEELCRCYGSANNPKCKTKYRSIYFNFKDNKNTLFREIISGNIKPKVLVRMEPHEMASAELAEWRLKENQKELEAIKRAELDKLAEAKKQQLIDSGVDDAIVVAEETRPKDITDVIDAEKEKGSGEKEKKDGSSGSSHRRDKDKASKDKNKDDKHRTSRDHKDRHRRDRDKEKDSHRKSSRHRHRSSERSKESKSREKDKKQKDESDSGKSSKSSHHSSIHSTKSNKESDHTNSADKFEGKVKNEMDTKIDDTSSTSNSGEDSTPQQQSTPTENAKSDPRHSTDSEQEQPSSTIKTPDFVEESSAISVQYGLLNAGGSKPIFKSQLTMQELGQLSVSVYEVSHVGLEGKLFPEAPVPFVGRIGPDTVWDYINKMKKTKEVIVFRLAPATQADTTIYNSFYDYLSARSRLGVLGSINHPLKDVYLCPLDKHTPINRALLPFRGGPGIPKERTNCLLAIVTRHIVDVHPGKRKLSVSSEVAGKKKLKVDANKSVQNKSVAGKSDARKISVDNKNEAIPGTCMTELELSQIKVDVDQLKDDDDEPYTPWEDDDAEVDVSSDKPVLSSVAAAENTQRLLDELNAKIEHERQEIESIAGAISNRKNLTGIPGLDGDFPTSAPPMPNVIAKPAPVVEEVPFFLRKEPAVSSKKTTSQSITIPGLDVDADIPNSNIPFQETNVVIDLGEEDYDDEPVEIAIEPQTYAADPRKGASAVKVPSEPVGVGIGIPPTETIPGLSNNTDDVDMEEAYSPSAIQFSDEEDKKDLEDSQDGSDPMEDEPLPPGIENETEDTQIPPPPPVVRLEDPRLTSSSFVEISPPKVPTPTLELSEESEPPPPGEVPSPPSPPIKITMPKIFENSASNEFPFPSIAPLQKTPQKKININLSTKSLPPPPAEKEEQVVSKSEVVNVQPPKVTSTAETKKESIKQMPQLQLHAPPPQMPKLHHPPPCIPTLQKAPMPPSMPIPIQIPPPSLQTVPPMPVQMIPPPNLQSGPPPPMALGINVNVPPPPLSGLGRIPQIPGMMPRGLPPLTPGGIRFPPPTSIPPPPIVNTDVGLNIIGGVRRPFIPPVPNPLATKGAPPRFITPPRPQEPEEVVTENSNSNSNVGLPRTCPPLDSGNEHNVARGRDRESRFERNTDSRDRDLDLDRRRGFQPADRGRNFRRPPFDNRSRRRFRSRSKDPSRSRSRSRSRERRWRRGERSRSPAWRRRPQNKRSRSRSPRSNRRSMRTRSRSRSRSRSPTNDSKTASGSRSSNRRRRSRSKDRSPLRSSSSPKQYSKSSKSRSRSKSKSESHSPTAASKSQNNVSGENEKSPKQDTKSPLVGSREEDWEDDMDNETLNDSRKRGASSEKEAEPAFEFTGEKGLHLSPDIVQMN